MAQVHGHPGRQAFCLGKRVGTEQILNHDVGRFGGRVLAPYIDTYAKYDRYHRRSIQEFGACYSLPRRYQLAEMRRVPRGDCLGICCRLRMRWYVLPNHLNKNN